MPRALLQNQTKFPTREAKIHSIISLLHAKRRAIESIPKNILYEPSIVSQPMIHSTTFASADSIKISTLSLSYLEAPMHSTADSCSDKMRFRSKIYIERIGQ